MWWIFGLFGFIYIAASSFSSVSALSVLVIGAVIGFFSMMFNSKKKPDMESLLVKNLMQTINQLEARLAKVESALRVFMKGSNSSAIKTDEIAQTDETTASEISESESTALKEIELETSSANTEAIHADILKKVLSDDAMEKEAMPKVDEALDLSIAPNLASEKNIHLPSEKALSAAAQIASEASSTSTALPQNVTSSTPINPRQARSAATQSTPVSVPRPPAKPWRETLPAPIANLLFGGNALVKVGVLILFLGLAFLLRYTAERVTVPIELRYASVALVGVGLLALGWLLRNKRRDYALILQGMAIGVFYLTILSAMKMHQLVSFEAGFVFMLAVSLLSAALAVLQKAPMLAIVAALEGFITPILTSTGENRPMGLFLYLSILDIGIFCIAWFNAWRVLNVIAFVGTFTLSLGWANKFYTHAEYGITQSFLIFFFILFTVIGVLFARRTLLEARVQINSENESVDALVTLKQVGRVDSALVFGTPITAFGLQYILMQPFEYGAAFSALILAFFYLLLGRLVFSKEKKGLALLAESYVIIAAIFGTLAIPLGLEGTWTSAAWAIEGAGMYWLGIRQARPYARAFAFLVIIGASIKLSFAMTMSALPFTPLLEGSILGPVLLAASVFVMWHLYRQAAKNIENAWEATLSAMLPWIGMAALSCLPWMLLMPGFAAAAVAMMAVVLAYLGLRYTLPQVRVIAAVMQALSLLSFLQTLHFNQSPDNGGLLADGWRGAIAAIVIAVSILVNAARHMLKAKREAEAQGLPASWSLVNGIAVVTAFALLHMSMLFVLDYSQVAWIWPLTSCMVFWAALRMSHIPLAIFSIALQLISSMMYRALEFDANVDNVAEQFFSGPLFLIPLSLSVAAWWCADRIRMEAVFLQKTLSTLFENNTSASSKPWTNAWSGQTLFQWCLVMWGLAWWLHAWIPEIGGLFKNSQHALYLMSVYVMFAIATSGLMLVLAKVRQWATMGASSIIGLLLMIAAALFGMNNIHHATVFLPSMYLGWLVWPLAFGWHLWSMRLQQQWLVQNQNIQKMMHVVGFWFFLILAASEVKIRFGLMSETGSNWALLGWILMPTLVLWLIGTKGIAKRWPLNQFRASYIETACTPVAIYLLIWCWVTNIGSAGNAHPLSYIPLFNPLEIAQGLILLCLMLWWRHLSDAAFLSRSKKAVKIIFAMTAFALLTGSVLRSVHHFGGVAWDGDVLFASRLAQASLSITWAMCGVALMLLGNRKALRNIWIVGAFLLGIVVLKLFVIELADRGGLYRIISFIGVGVALLVVGYFAPVPVKKADISDPIKEAA